MASPPVRSAAACSDYSNQAEAQREKDTRDADGDGIYCEALPCPCSKPGARRRGNSRARARPARGHEPATAPAHRRIDRAPGRLVDVIDGDTVKVRLGGRVNRTYTVRARPQRRQLLTEPTSSSRSSGRSGLATMGGLSSNQPPPACGTVIALPRQGTAVTGAVV